jgi:hypothetical protein
MDNKWNKWGKAGSILSENAGFMILIALAGNKIPPEYLFILHTLIMSIKGVYLQFKNPISRHDILEKIANLLVTQEKVVIVTKELANSLAEAVAKQIRDNGMKMNVVKMSETVFDEMSK